MKAEDLINLIRQRYPLDRLGGYQSHVVLEQVPDGTGMYQGRWIDAVVFSLWASKGLTRSAFEVKVSRSDFLHELQNQVKHQWCLECFHEFWFVAPSDVIQLEELPHNVGWLSPKGNKLTIKRHAVKNPNPRLDDVLLAAFMRAASKEIDNSKKVNEKEVLEQSVEFQRAKNYRDAITEFIRQRGNASFLDPSTPQEVLKWLEDATMDKQLKQDREHLQSLAGRFQREVSTLLGLFAVIAQKSILARNDLGSHIVNAYGGTDEYSLESLKDYAKNGKYNDSQKRYAELVEVIMNWGKL